MVMLMVMLMVIVMLMSGRDRQSVADTRAPLCSWLFHKSSS